MIQRGMTRLIVCVLVVSFCCHMALSLDNTVHPAVPQHQHPKSNTSLFMSAINFTIQEIEHHSIISDFFQKHGNGSHIHFEALEHFMHELGLGGHWFNHSVDHHKNDKGEFVPKHGDHDHQKPDDDHGHSHDEYQNLKEHVGAVTSSVSNNTCLSASQIFDILKLKINQTITKKQFDALCPYILVQMEQKACRPKPLQARKGVPSSSLSAWIGALTSVGVISVAGLIVISIVPILSKSRFFDHVVQFLISLAVGTLTSDALLHLLPHAMVPHSHNSGSPQTSANNHKYVSELSNNALWVGLATFTSILFFFVVERLLKMVAGKDHVHDDEHIEINDMNHEGQATFQNGSAIKASLHNHSHHIPSGILSSAWMVAMGDGLHNFADGLAIGASFANSLSVGLSTSVAVLCHELPHELGDFASLLTAGMSIKQAIMCNLVSSVLCLAGVCLGVSIGNYLQSLTTWVFAVTAGIFLYVALVDMLPQMTKTYENHKEAPIEGKTLEMSRIDKGKDFLQSHSFKTLLLHLSGVGVGLTIMLLIGLYEDCIVIDVI